jgi:thymidine kinase
MNDITFYYSVMGSGKSTYALQLNYSLKQAGFNPVLLKPKLDTRDNNKVKSRIGIEEDCLLIDNNLEIPKNCTHLIIDEAQFLSQSEISMLNFYSIENEIPLYFFGLRTSYTGKLFEGSAILMAIADNLIELPLIYKDGNKATMHLRFINNNAIFEGDPINVGDLIGSERYESVSRVEYFKRLNYENNKEVNR